MVSKGKIGQASSKSEGFTVSSDKINLAFVVHEGMDSFLKDLLRYFSQLYNVRLYKPKDQKDLKNALSWADICWFEWCDDLLVQTTSQTKNCSIICRLHSYEAFSDVPDAVNWNKVDDLIIVAPHIREIVEQRWPSIKKLTRIHTIPIGVNLQHYTFCEHKKGYDIGYIGYINVKKGPMLLLHCLQHLVKLDSRYRLHIAGSHQDLRFKLYFDKMITLMGLEKNLIMYGWVDDINAWLKDKNYCINTSPLESGPMCIREAMSCGVKPLIHNFVGAGQMYPSKYLFTTIVDLECMVESDEYDSVEYRRFIERYYALPVQLKKTSDLIKTVALSNIENNE